MYLDIYLYKTFARTRNFLIIVMQALGAYVKHTNAAKETQMRDECRICFFVIFFKKKRLTLIEDDIDCHIFVNFQNNKWFNRFSVMIELTSSTQSFSTMVLHKDIVRYFQKIHNNAHFWSLLSFERCWLSVANFRGPVN